MNPEIPPLLSPGPPPIPFQPPPIPSQRPVTVVRYRLWCALIVGIYLAVFVYELLIVRGVIEADLGPITEMLVGGDTKAKQELLIGAREQAFDGVMGSALGAIFYTVAGFVPRRRWGWVLGMIAIIGSIFPFIITAAGAVPLLIFWQRPEIKIYFWSRK